MHCSSRHVHIKLWISWRRMTHRTLWNRLKRRVKVETTLSGVDIIISNAFFHQVQQQAASFCEQYSKVKGAGSPQRHPFFLQLDSLIRRVQSAVEFENNVMFVSQRCAPPLQRSSRSFFSHHKRAATDLASLDNNPVHGVLPAEEYVPANLSTFFSMDAYRAFDIGRNVGKVNRSVNWSRMYWLFVSDSF